MEPHIIDYYNDTPNIVNVIDKMNIEKVSFCMVMSRQFF